MTPSPRTPNQPRHQLDRARFCFSVGLRGVRMGTLAQLVGISPGFLSNLKSGRRTASASLVIRLAAALQVPAEYLLPEIRGTDVRTTLVTG
jgi:transcriptional regulator with XRE-family HTH domain